MPSVCEQCANEFTSTPMKCGGFCSGLFCMKCSGMTEEACSLVDNNSHIIWMCYACCNILTKSRFSNAVTSVNAANEKIIDALKTEIKDSILNDIRTEIRTNFKSLIDAVPSTPLASRPPSLRLSSRNKRQREADVDDEDISVNRPPKLLCGTGTINSEVPSVAVNPTSATSEFRLYLSGIQPDVADDKVHKMVLECLGTNEFKLVKLIPRGKDQRTLTFVSFKVIVSTDLKEKAMSAHTWPMGIRFREFEDHGLPRLGFWRPASPVPVITTTHSAATSDPQRLHVA